jgi:hypothetical protein
VANLIQADRVWKATPSDTVSEPVPFVGLQFSAAAASTALSIATVTNNTGARVAVTVTWADGELSKGVTYPISGYRVNLTGTAATPAITLYGA